MLPALRERWPGLNRRLRHTADACAESEALNRKLATLQWQAVGGEQDRLPVEGLKTLSLAEQKNLIRWWVRERGWVGSGTGEGLSMHFESLLCVDAMMHRQLEAV